MNVTRYVGAWIDACMLSIVLLLSGCASAGAAPLRVVTVGDSITNGYTPYLAEGLPGYRVIGRGASGASARQWADTTLETALADDPDVVCVLLGTNDAARAIHSPGQIAIYRAAMGEILERVAAARNGRDRAPLTILGTVIPIVAPSPYAAATPMIADTIDPWLRAEADSRGILVVDLFADVEALDDHMALYRDGVHLSAEGYRWMAGEWAAAIRSLVNTRPWVGDRSGLAGRSVSFWGYLWNRAGPAMPDRPLTLEVNGGSVAEGVTGADGRCLLTFTVPEGTDPGVLEVRLRYEGDMSTFGGVAESRLQVSVPTWMWVGNRAQTAGKAIQFWGYLQRKDTREPIVGRTVWLSIGGERAASAVTGSDGRALLTYRIPATKTPGAYAVSVEFVGADGYLAGRAASTLTVTAP
ncbi:MAG: hypothetical protein IT208_10560 [Chthonomonadales bacterium]|nr:hypothetical protein [Chthonomonadales bacterium]